MYFSEIMEALQAGFSVKAPELTLWTISIAAYCVLIYHFYRFVAKRDIFGFDPMEIELERRDSRRHLYGTLAGVLKYGALFPAIVFIWFSGFAVLLFILAKQISIQQILSVSVGFVTAIRLASYYSEDLARDMAKLIPFVLLGVAIVEPSFFSFTLFIERTYAAPSLLQDLLVYFVFIIGVEWVLRIALAMKHWIFGAAKAEKSG